MTDTQKRVRGWFRAKRSEMLASAALAQDHPTLIGSHREFFIRDFLTHFLPSRLSADRGIIYNFMSHSGECDVVVWDSANFPRLSMLDHSAFFIESVVSVIEVKSTYSREEFRECLVRHEALRHLDRVSGTHVETFENEFEMLKAEVIAVRDHVSYNGMGITHPSIGYVVVFLKGGRSVSLSDLFEEDDDLMEIAPDLITFVDAGITVQKYVPDLAEWRDGATGRLRRSAAGEDVLLDFTDSLLGVIRRRSFATDGLTSLGPYAPWAFTNDRGLVEEIPVLMTHFPPGRQHLHGDPPGGSTR